MPVLDDEDLKAKEQGDFDDIVNNNWSKEEQAKLDSLAKTNNDIAEETEGFYHPEGGKMTKAKKKKSAWRKGALFGGGLGVIFSLLGLMFLLNFFKIPHFTEVLTATGYSRLNSILRERSTQDIFDASLVDGNGSIQASGQSLFEKMRGINPDADLAALGREGKISFDFGEGKTSFLSRKAGDFKGITIGGKEIYIDDIGKEFGFGESYKDLSFTERARVRYEFTNRIKAGVSDTMALEPRYVRSRAFKTIADTVGFDFNRWPQKARDFIGKTPREATAENTAESIEKTSGPAPTETTGIDEVDQTIKDVKAQQKIKDYLSTHDVFDPQAFVSETYQSHLGFAENLRSASEKVGKFTVLMAAACIVNINFDKVDDINRQNVNNAEREALYFASAGSQTKYGDVTGEAQQAEISRLRGADLSPAYQYDTGNPSPNIPPDFQSPSVKQKFDPGFINLIKTVTSPTTIGTLGLSEAIKQVPGLGDLFGAATDQIDAKFCEALLSPQGMIIATVGEVAIQAVIAFFSDGSATIATEEGAGYAAQQVVWQVIKSMGTTARGLLSVKSLATLGSLGLLDWGMHYLVLSMANQSFSGGEQGADYYERARIGTCVVQSHNFRSSLYGRSLDPGEAKVVDASSQEELKDNWNSKSAFNRYFATANPYSIASSVVAKSPSGLASAASSFQQAASSLGTLFSPKNLLGPILSFMNHTAAAQKMNGYDPCGDIQQWGYSADEVDKLRNDTSYGIEANEQWIIDHPKEVDEFENGPLDSKGNRTGPGHLDCFTTPSQYDADKLVEGHCSPQELSSELALRYRIHKGLDKYVVDELTSGLTT